VDKYTRNSCILAKRKSKRISRTKPNSLIFSSNWDLCRDGLLAGITVEIQRMKPGAVPVLATTGVVTPMAAAQIGQRGRKIVHIKP
jgi:hypothetical protein